MSEAARIKPVATEPQEQRALSVVPNNGLTFANMMQLAEAIARSGLFGMKTKEQALALMSIAHAEGRHPALAARDFDIIQGRPAKKAEAMQRDFLEAGGRITWHALSDEIADATFSHQQGGSVRIVWDMARAKRAGLAGKDMYQKFPRQMLRSRTISEGVRTVWPLGTSGMYVPEEAMDFEASGAPLLTSEPIKQPEEPPADTRREAINAETPLGKPAAAEKPPRPKMTRAEWLTSLSIALKESKTEVERTGVLVRQAKAIEAARETFTGADLERLEMLLQPPTDPVAEIGSQVFDGADPPLGEAEPTAYERALEIVEDSDVTTLMRLRTDAEFVKLWRACDEAQQSDIDDRITGRVQELRMSA